MIWSPVLQFAHFFCRKVRLCQSTDGINGICLDTKSCEGFFSELHVLVKG